MEILDACSDRAVTRARNSNTIHEITRKKHETSGA